MATPGITTSPAPKAHLETIISGLHPLEVRALGALAENVPLSEVELGARASMEPEQVRTAVQWLLAKELIAATSTESYVEVSLTEVGERHAASGVPETRILGLLSRPAGEAPVLRSPCRASPRFPSSKGKTPRPPPAGSRSSGVIAIEPGGTLRVADRERAQIFADLEALIRRIGGAEGRGPPRHAASGRASARRGERAEARQGARRLPACRPEPLRVPARPRADSRVARALAADGRQRHRGRGVAAHAGDAPRRALAAAALPPLQPGAPSIAHPHRPPASVRRVPRSRAREVHRPRVHGDARRSRRERVLEHGCALHAPVPFGARHPRRLSREEAEPCECHRGALRQGGGRRA